MTTLDCLFLGQQSHQVHTAARDIVSRIEEIAEVLDSGNDGLLATKTEAPLLLEALMKLHNLVYYVEAHRA